MRHGEYGPVTVWCRSFDHVMCSKGAELGAQAGRMNFARMRIALTSGLSRRQVADDLGVGLSTLNKWVNAHRDTDVVSFEDRELARENERLRREIRILREEREVLKNRHGPRPACARYKQLVLLLAA